ncbi:hypothetical protein DFJ77DRAFT_247997 [Powellomyces hirtus]|nr:hypothetical protein DFJ77DRAFT_247997 [Powellomyces hirtus]
MVMSWLLSFTSAHSLVIANQVIYDSRIRPLHKFMLLWTCATHTLQKILFTYLFDAFAPRNCWATITVSNVFGLCCFRFSMMFMFGQLLLTLGKRAMWAKVCWALGMICWAISCGILLYVEYTSPPFGTCMQDLAANLTTGNNVAALIAFAFMAFPIIGVLAKHISSTKGTSMSSGSAVKRVYITQIAFLVVFTVMYIVLCIASQYMNELYPMLYCFIFADYVWLCGIYLWLLPQAPQSTSQTSQLGGAKTQMVTATGHRQSIANGGTAAMPGDRRRTTEITEEA